MPTSKLIDKKTPKLSGPTNWTASAPSAPATPVIMALTPNVMAL